MEIKENVSMEKYNTFMLPSKASSFCEVNSIDDIKKLKNLNLLDGNKYILGEGSNTIFTKDFDGLVIKINILGKNIIQENNNEIEIKVGSGEKRIDFVLRCAENKYVGIENLSYIPSSVGASAVQNIGAYGAEAKDIIQEVEYVDLETMDIKVLKNHECAFGYRDSIFKHDLKDKIIIISVTYKLKKYIEGYEYDCKYAGISEKIEELGFDKNNMEPFDFVNIITEIRKSKLPDWHEIGTAGSFFKNPIISQEDREYLQKKFPDLKGFESDGGIKLSAGQLIDMCGFKGKGNGKVGTYYKHALILVNEGSAEGKDVVSFACEVQNTVKEKFGVQIDPEAIMI